MDSEIWKMCFFVFGFFGRGRICPNNHLFQISRRHAMESDDSYRPSNRLAPLALQKLWGTFQIALGFAVLAAGAQGTHDCLMIAHVMAKPAVSSKSRCIAASSSKYSPT